MIQRAPISPLFPYTTLFRSAMTARQSVERRIGFEDAFRTGDSGASDGRQTRLTELERRSEPTRRSEEHTSELQSHHDLVCRLLLEKKNNTRSQATSVL